MTVGTSLIDSGFIPVPDADVGWAEVPKGTCVAWGVVLCPGVDDCPAVFPLPKKNTRAMITTAMIPTTAAILTHGLSHGSFLLLIN
ncbi:MAG: hypothetical protein CVV30_12225 [Methanomicrobiales archaeon HGW-Methanomicrobiales-1]|nr:MAG: hypothetical protein CVV30_12225 [Methanomicrobiales archaeon HGW-Methanomicrobiales-1]